MKWLDSIEKNDLDAPGVLRAIWSDALEELAPERVFRAETVANAGLFWGKAALRTAEALARGRDARQFFVVAPRGSSAAASRLRAAGARVFEGEHPIPGEGSFAAGEAMLEFFRELGESGARSLDVFLSGGASALAWVRPYAITERTLLARLDALYRKPLPIDRLNAERSRLCALKAGGAARLLKSLAPAVDARVRVISDVAPFGPEVVGSGPFWDGKVPHEVVADNASLARAAARSARRHGESVLVSAALPAGASWADWAAVIAERAKYALASEAAGILAFGGEPVVALPSARGIEAGGRQTQLACALGALLAREIARGRVELLCGASDGRDGSSGASGAVLDARVVTRAGGLCNFQQNLEKAARSLRSASGLAAIGALIPEADTGTNLQDLVLIRACPR